MYAMTDKSRTVESDRFFKDAASGEWSYESSGNVEAPTNWFCLLEVDAHLREAWTYQIPASVEDGLYLVSIDNNGLVWAEQADTDEATRANYNELHKQYLAWEAGDDDE